MQYIITKTQLNQIGTADIKKKTLDTQITLGAYISTMFFSVAVLERNVNQLHLEEGNITSVLLVCTVYNT